MTAWLIAAGWLVALCSGAVAAAARRQLATRADAVADACHELRGPLTSACLGLELGVRRGRLSTAQVRAIELELKRAVLALEDLEADGPVPEQRARRSEWVSVRELVSDSVQAWRPAASAAGSRLELRWQGGEAWLIGDRLRLAQATGNLIANAIEHGGGTIEVIGRFQGGVVRIEVLDSGPGLPAPVAELVRAAGRKGDRRGRGLKIVSAIAAAHGGRLAAGPAPSGARVVLALPALDSAAHGISRHP